MSSTPVTFSTTADSGTKRSVEIRCEEVAKQFTNETAPAVDHVSLKVDPGSFVVLLGPSGCGKTTLLKMINRLYEPTAGKIWIGGTEVQDLQATELRRGIGYVIQQVGLFPHMTIAENISIVPRLLKWDRKRTDERVNQLLELVGLPLAYRVRYPRKLSGGEQQRVGLARALAADPAILLMDEPFAAIDAINRECLQEELLEIQHKVNKTVMFVTHDVEEAFRLADKIVVMKSGKIVQYGTPLEIVTQPQDEFVQELVGTNNMLRRLSLIDVQSVLDARSSWASQQALSNLHLENVAIVRPEDDLRSALSTFLNSDFKTVQVVDRDGRQVGSLTFEDLRAALVEHAPRLRVRMQYLINNYAHVLDLFGQHLRLTGVVLGISLLIAVPVGVLVVRVRWLQGPVLGILGVVYTIPSLSLFVLLIPIFGLGSTTASIALIAYAQLMLVRNWAVGLMDIDPAVIEAAKGMGMSGWQRFWRVEFPLALPLLLAGARLATLSTIGIGTIAAYINAGGLGTLLFEGVITANYQKILVGSLAVSVLAVGMNYLLRFLERRAEIAVRGESR